MIEAGASRYLSKDNLFEELAKSARKGAREKAC